MPNYDESLKSNSFDGQSSKYLSSYNTFNTQNNNSLQMSGRSSFLPETDATASGTYNSNSGYGLIDASKAVSQVTGQSPYSDVPKLGGNNWGLDMIKAPAVWNNGYTGQGVVVAVIDTGVDYNHVDLKNNIWINSKEIAGNGIDDDGNGYVDDVQGWNFDGNNNNPLDDNGHGTHVSGILAAEKNDYGVTGVAYNAKIMPVKVLNSSGTGAYSAIANGIYYAVNNGAKVINLSLGGDFSSETLKSAIEYASSKGVILVMAAGNDGNSSPTYPARYADKSGIAVGAVDENGNFTDFSNRSGSKELAYVTAPGKNIYSTLPGNEYGINNGTSMASPYVAGVVALMLSANPNLTESQIRQIITSTANNSSNNNTPNSDFNFNFNPFLDTFLGGFSPNSPLNLPFNSSLKPFSDSNTHTNSSTLEHSEKSLPIKIQFEYQYSDSKPVHSLANSPTDNNNLDFGQLINEIITKLKDYQNLLR